MSGEEEVKQPDEGLGEEAAVIGTPEDSARIDSIMKVDTHALLGVISNIERELALYQKQDVIPNWGQGMQAKLDLLETMVNRTPRGGGGGGDGPAPEPSPFMAGAGGGGGVSSHGKNDELLSKMRKEMTQHVDTTASSFDYKMNAVSLELDRLHKLLQIRPTTSELQQVVLSIHDISRKMEDGVRDVKKAVRGQVSDKVAEEMATIIANVQGTADLNAQSIGLIAKKVDGYNGDITSIRKATEQTCDTMNNNIKKCMYDTQASKELVLQLQERADVDAAKAEQGIKELQFSLNMANEKIEGVQGGVRHDLDKFTKAMQGQDEQVKELLADAAAKLGEMTIVTTATKKDIDDFRLAYEVDVKSQMDANTAATDKVRELDEKFTEVNEYVMGLKDSDIMNLIELQNDQISTVKTSIEDTEASLSSMTNKMNKMSKTVKKAEEEMERLPEMVKSANDRVNDLTAETEQMKEKINKQELELAEHKKRIEELEKLNDEIALLKVTVKDMDAKLKQSQTTAMSLLEANGDHEKRLESMTELIDNSDAMVEQKMLKMQGEIMDNVAAKQAEVEALVANMHENIEVMGLGGENSSQEMSQTRSGGGGKPRPGSRSKAGGGGGGGHSNPAASGHAPISMTGSQEGSQVLSQDEKNDVIDGSAEFIADLCVNFEEISVRKTYVADLPSAMCENITATAQSLTSFIANITDSEAIQTVLRGNSAEVEYDENVVSEMRGRKVEAFCLDVMQIVEVSNSQPGAVRQEARTKFMRQIKRALDLCMSKHDQVLIVGNSRGSRIKIPTCIACDRPLLEKVRQEQMVGRDGGQHKDFPLMGGGGRPIVETTAESVPEGGFDGVAGSPPPRNKQRGGKGVRVPNVMSEKVMRPNSSNGGKDAMNLRASLKVPRPGMSNASFAPPEGGDRDAEGMFPVLAASQSHDML
jgi:hypothetical protein